MITKQSRLTFLASLCQQFSEQELSFIYEDTKHLITEAAIKKHIEQFNKKEEPIIMETTITPIAKKLDIATVDINKMIDFTNAMIKFDNVDLIKSATEITDKYKGLVVVEEILPEIKTEVATLNKLVKQLETQRIAIKNQYNQPYNEFETKIKEVTGIINNTVLFLNKQLAVFEQQRKDKKRQEVQQLIDKMVAEYQLRAKYSSQVLMQEKFLNATETMAKIRQTLDVQFSQLQNAQDNEDKAIELQKQLEAEKKKQLEERIARRHELIAHYNAKHGLSITYDGVKHLSDVQLSEHVEDMIIIDAPIVEEQQPRKQLKTNIEQTAELMQPKCYSTAAPLLLNPVITEQPIIKTKVLKISGLNDADFKEVMETLEQLYPNAKLEVVNE